MQKIFGLKYRIYRRVNLVTGNWRSHSETMRETVTLRFTSLINVREFFFFFQSREKSSAEREREGGGDWGRERGKNERKGEGWRTAQRGDCSFNFAWLISPVVHLNFYKATVPILKLLDQRVSVILVYNKEKRKGENEARVRVCVACSDLRLALRILGNLWKQVTSCERGTNSLRSKEEKGTAHVIHVKKAWVSLEKLLIVLQLHLILQDTGGSLRLTGNRATGYFGSVCMRSVNTSPYLQTNTFVLYRRLYWPGQRTRTYLEGSSLGYTKKRKKLAWCDVPQKVQCLR